MHSSPVRLIVVAVLLLALLFVAWLLLRPSAPLDDEGPEPTTEELAKAAIELHRISRRLDIAFARHELRSDVLRTQRELDQELRLLKVLGGNDESS